MTDQMHYELRLANTSSGVGYFACAPIPEASLDGCLGYLRRCPLDDFMHKHVLDMICAAGEDTVRSILGVARDRDPIMVALIGEACLAMEKFVSLRGLFSRDVTTRLVPYSPLINMKSSLLEDQALHRKWGALFGENLGSHRDLPHPDAADLPFPYPETTLATASGGKVPVRSILERDSVGPNGRASAMPSPEETAARALDKLQSIGAFAGNEMKHVSSLSPYGFFRKWNLRLEVKNGRHDYTVQGIQTSYGKGLTEAGARASYAMEMVERVSSFASFGPDGVLGTARDYPLTYGALSDLAGKGRNVLDPNHLRLEVPYGDEPLAWIEAAERAREGSLVTLIPAQTVFLFCNLDEISLFSGLGSTGLASGNTMEQAKVSALLEVLERDCEATTVYDPSRCFGLEGSDPVLGPLLEGFATKGLQLRFQELTNGLGAPCYKCYVVGARGEVVKGTGAHLDGRKALVSALTETPFAFYGTALPPQERDDLPIRRFEDLPDYSRGDPAGDLEILEHLLFANGFRILYVDLTRKDIGIPVVKAIVPGMEFMADFDEYSRISPRLFADYLGLAGRK